MLADREGVHFHARDVGYFPVNDNGLDEDSPSLSELIYLRRALTQPGGKLPLFDMDGQEVASSVVRRCLARGWAEPWFHNPLKPDWLVCKLTAEGRRVAGLAP